jgi:hypothetical protein
MPINVSLRKMTLKGILKNNIVLTVNRYLSRNGILLKNNATSSRRDMTTLMIYNSVVVYGSTFWITGCARLIVILCCPPAPLRGGYRIYVSYEVGKKAFHIACASE